MSFSISFTTEPPCKTFLKIRENDQDYSIDAYAEKYPVDMDEQVKEASILYRDNEYTYSEYINYLKNFADDLQFFQFESKQILESPITYFVKKAMNCLQFARFFLLKSACLLDTNDNIQWKNGYVPQYLIRGVNFETAALWYSNCFEHILQIVYWGAGLHDLNPKLQKEITTDTIEALLKKCTFMQVKRGLAERDRNDIQEALDTCSSEIRTVRDWANYVKHKGGIDFQFIEPPRPYEVYLKPYPATEVADDTSDPHFTEEDLCTDFKSPIELDMDKEYETLKKAHHTLYSCLETIVGILKLK